MRRVNTGILICALCWLTYGADAVELNPGKFWGQAFVNYHHDFSQERDSTSGRENSFEITRMYFGYDRDLDEKFSLRFLLDVNNTKDADGKKYWRPFLKQAYLTYSGAFSGNVKFYAGMIPMPYVSIPQSHWGYRSIFRSSMNSWRDLDTKREEAKVWGYTVDLGVGFKGNWWDLFQLEFALANGAGYKLTENDMLKLLEIRPTVYLWNKNLVISPFCSFEALNDSSNALITAVMAGYDHERFRIGAEYNARSVSKGAVDVSTSGSSVETLSANCASLWLHVKPSAKITLLGRYDLYDPNSDLEDDEFDFLILGCDYHPRKNVHIIPNVQFQSYQADRTDTPAVAESQSKQVAYITLEYKW